MSTKADVTERLEPVVRIRPSKGWNSLELGALWEYRELVYYMVWRDIKVRYKQTVLGVGWAVVQPVATMVVFTVVFGRLANLPSNGIPYPLFTMAALLPWQLFSSAFSGAANSVAGNAAMISKVYFPRLIAPLAAIGATLVDFGITLAVLSAMMIWYRVVPTSNLIFLPVFVAIALLAALAVGVWTAALNVKYRDIRYLLPYLLQLWLFMSPVAYSIDLVPEKWRILYGLNPMVGVIQGFRWAMFGGTAPGPLTVVAAVASAGLLVGGLFYFRRAEDAFSDFI